MAGQGRPYFRAESSLCDDRGHRYLRALVSLLLLFAWSLLATSLIAQELNLTPANGGITALPPPPEVPIADTISEGTVRLRLAWGGSAPQSWQGSIAVSAGRITTFTPLGLEADVPGSLYLSEDQTSLQIQPHSPSQFDGCDISIEGGADATLRVELASLGKQAGPESAPVVYEIPVREMARQLTQRKLDEQGSQFLAQRSPGDVLAVRLDRPHMVFGPQEDWRLPLALSPLDLQPSTTYLLELRICKGRTSEEIGADRLEFRTDALAKPTTAPQFAIKSPPREGVYDLHLSLYAKRLTTSLVKGKPVSSRTLQFVVLEPQPLPVPHVSQEFHLVQEIDPTKAHWWEKMGRMKALKNLSTMNSGSVGSEKAQTRAYLGKNLLELKGNGWHAYPLELERPGEPHRLEIEYPSDWRQSVSISIVEPNAAGQVVPIGVDSAIEVREPSLSTAPGLQEATLEFWPKTRMPWVLIANRRDDRSALLGKLSLYAGPANLLPMELGQGTGLAGGETGASGPGGRQLLAYLDRPLSAENFSATQAVDRETGRSLEDWQAAYEAGTRLVEHLKRHGYTGAVLTVACEGGTIYPSQKLEPTPQWDSGIFFESGQDPMRKDVVEMLHRLFDRAGLTLVPAIKFSTPLPALEQEIRQDANWLGGLMPVGADGKTWVQRNGVQRGQGVFYNTLDPRVQQAMRDVLEELSQRYGHHRSFGGVCVPWELEGYALLPDDSASFDDATIERFVRSTGIDLAKGNGSRFVERAAQLRSGGPHARAWQEFRCMEMANFYRRIQADLARRNLSARLYLGTGQLLGAKTWQPGIRPTLPAQQNLQALLLASGIDSGKLAADVGIVVPRPQRILTGATEAEAVQSYWNSSDELNQIGEGASQLAGMHFIEPAPLRLPAFDKASPFGSDKTRSWFVSQFVPSGAAARERFARSLAAGDMQLLVDGGWMLPMMDLAQLDPLVETYRQLPAEPFQAVAPRSESGMSQSLNLAVRKLTNASGTLFYVVNPYPWPVTVEVNLSHKTLDEVVTFAPHVAGVLQPGSGNSKWTCELEPYDLVAAQALGRDIRLSHWHSKTSPEVSKGLTQQVRDLRLRAAALRTPEPKSWLANPGFEAPEQPQGMAGWVHSAPSSSEVRVEADAGHESDHAVLLRSERSATGQPSVAWLRSDPFQPPRSGRLALFAWIKPVDPSKQPKLRMAMEGKLDGKTYYRRRNLGTSEDGRSVKALQEGWALYRFSLNDLPLSGLTDMRVGFDLMDEGGVLIDDIQVYDLWFEDYERDELLKLIATADFQLSSGRLEDALRLVDGYWGRYLKEYVPVPAPAVARSGDGKPAVVPASGTSTTKTPEKPLPPAPAKPTNVFDKMKNWWSKPTVR